MKLFNMIDICNLESTFSFLALLSRDGVLTQCTNIDLGYVTILNNQNLIVTEMKKPLLKLASC